MRYTERPQCCLTKNLTLCSKIIGARYYRSDGNVPPEDFASPRDTEGHGTHTASTAAGNVVSGASLLHHQANGRALVKPHPISLATSK